MEGNTRRQAAEPFGLDASDEPTPFEQGLEEVRPAFENPAQAAILASGMDAETLSAIEDEFSYPQPGVENYPDAN